MPNNADNLCMACMDDMEGNDVCPNCGHSNDEIQMENALPLKHMLQGKYIVGKAIEANGEGVGYIGYDTVARSPVYIREYMPGNLCFRDSDGVGIVTAKGSELSFTENERSFLEYNRRLGSLRSINAIIPIFDIFSENGTDYVIAEWVENITLREFVERSGGRVDWNTARLLFMPVLSALSELQRAGVHHFGITPENLIVLRTGRMRLRGFCIPEVRRKDSDLKPDIYDGCSAIEQYTHGATLGSYTDIYGFVACLFFALTGELPQSATRRKNDGKLLIPTAILETIPPHIVTALANGLQVNTSFRTQSLERLREELSAAPTVTMAVNDMTDQAENPDEHYSTINKKGISIGVWIAIIAVLIIGVGAAFYFIFFNNSASKNAASSSSVEKSSSLPVSSSSQASGEISVPNLVGMNYEQAQNNAKAQGHYQVMLSSEEFSDTVAEGNIISQTPAFSVTAKMSKESVIAVVVSKGSSKRALPNIVGMTLSEASSTLTAKGFVPQKGSEKYSSTYSEGVVIDYDDYNVGDYIKYGSTVRLMVSKGKQQSSSESSSSHSSQSE